MKHRYLIILTAERLRELLHYENGVFTRLQRVGKSRVGVGSIAGTLNTRGYWQINVDGRLYYAHRLAWLWVTGEWPKGEVDHIDGDCANNRIENLRDVTHSTNKQNLKNAQANNKTGFLGVTQTRGKFRASIKVKDTVVHIGLSDTAELAHKAYLTAKRYYHQGNTL